MAVRSHRLVGRDEELDSLVRLLDAPDELPTTAAVVGEAGIGKTALWLAAVEEAAARGYLVLSCRPFEAEVGFSFSGLADLLGGLVAEVLPELPPPQRRALEVALGLSDSGAPVEERLVAFAFLNALRRLAERNPLLLAVDDVGWLDAPSLALLRYALPRLESESVAAVLTARGEFPAWLRRDVAAERLLELELSPLSVGALHELLRSRLDLALTRPVLLRVWKLAGGNPFFALELGRALQRRGGNLVAGEELPLSPSLEELLDERLVGLGASATDVVRAVAALAEPTSALVEAAAGVRAERGLAEALEAGVVVQEGERLRFSHPLLGARRAWEIYDDLGYFEPGHRLELADTLEALIVTGELDDAERRLVPWEERAQALDRAWAIAITARCRALLLAVRGNLQGAFASFDDALAAHERSVYPFEHARTLLALGATQRRAKQRRQARATLEQALAIFEQLGAPLWVEKTRAELARIGGRSRSRGELTESERRIAALVGEGRSNREVAAALFLTEHTVETALSRVYRKLGVRSRGELANRLAQQTEEPPPAKS